MIRRLTRCTALLALLLAAGCATRTTHQSSSVIQYLYPEKQQRVEPQPVTDLQLPLRVGIAFVPDTTGYSSYALTEKDRQELLKRVAAEFRQLPFVKGIEIIPSPYLTKNGSFANLDQIRTMYGVDIIALASYDQVQHTDQGLLSLSYWTLVGAWVVQGEKNDTSTMLDMAVYHIPSRRMLFRAPGTSHVKGSATPVNLGEQLRLDARAGFDEAAKSLTINLKAQLEAFKDKTKEAPAEFKVTAAPGYRGGGSMDGTVLLTVAAMSGLTAWSGRRNR